MNFTKLIWSILGTVALTLKTGLSDGGFDLTEQIALGALVLGTIGTWLIPNTPVLNAAKTWVNALSTGTALLATLVSGGLTGSEWLDVVILVLTTAGVYTFPNVKNRAQVPAPPL